MVTATRRLLCVIAASLAAQAGFAAEELVTSARYASGEPVPYILNRNDPDPAYVIILFPGGAGNVDPRMQDGKLVYGYQGNFLLRSRKFLVDDQFAAVTTDSTASEDRIQAVLDDISRRFPKAQVYLMGTSNGTYCTMALAGYLADRIAGEIHTSSLSRIYEFDARRYKNRHLVVHHRKDACWGTPYSAAAASHERYGNDFIAMEGGISDGIACQAFAYHGYNGIERETMAAIKQWIRQAR